MVAKIRDWASAHPRLAGWLALSVGMVIVMLFASSGAGIAPGNLVFLVLATIATAGLCVWIISWEDGDESEGKETPTATTKSTKG
ncbi:MAG: hypothetical protein K1X39_11195 [Thermoflexales bacterium]|nr:hypothetical protein [Thermoflexales bacterium]